MNVFWGRRSLLAPVIGAGLLSCSEREAEVTSPAAPDNAETRLPEPRSRWVDVTASWGLPVPRFAWPDGTYQVPELMAPGVGVFDADRDGLLDILLPTNPPPGQEAAANQFFRQVEPGRFREQAVAAGLAGPDAGQGVAIGDYDNDGFADVYCCNFGPDRLYRNRGDGTFEDITKTAGLSSERWTCSAAFVDYDRDGDLDLYAVHYVLFDPEHRCSRQSSAPEYCSPLEYQPTIDTLYQNDGNGRFVDVTKDGGIHLPGNGLGVVCSDFNDDRWVDLYVANDAEPNHFWINQRDGTFAEEGYLRGAAVNRHGKPEASMGVSLGDPDLDGDLDLFMTHISGENNTLFSAQAGGMFQDRSIDTELTRFDHSFTGFGCAFADFDLDGDHDLAVVNGRIRRGDVWPGAGLSQFWNPYAEPNQIFWNLGDGSYVEDTSPENEFRQAVEVSRGLALGDLDNDGDVDLVVASCGGLLRVFRNDAPESNHWLRIKPRAHGRAAIGARITVTAADKQWVNVCLRAFSYASSNEPAVTVGLGELRRVDQIHVLWPDGMEELFLGADAGRTLTLVKGTGEAP